MAVESRSDLYALPEDCIATALSLTSPKDACRLSLVGSTFRSAADSDAVWERFLPNDYREIISRSINAPDSQVHSRFTSKKDLYLYLCDHPILIDGGTMSFSLEKGSGKKCYMLAARRLSIVWGDTPQYWEWVSLPESRFSEAAELHNVCWFEMRCKMNTSMLSPKTKYAAYLVFTVKSRFYGFDHLPAMATVAVSGQDSENRSVCLDPDGAQQKTYQIVPRRRGMRWLRRISEAQMQQADSSREYNTHYPKKRDDGWMEVELGDYFVGQGQDEELEISLTEVEGGNWKSGIVVQGVEIRPKDC